MKILHLVEFQNCGGVAVVTLVLGSSFSPIWVDGMFILVSLKLSNSNWQQVKSSNWVSTNIKVGILGSRLMDHPEIITMTREILGSGRIRFY